jgi:hypothetical protein
MNAAAKGILFALSVAGIGTAGYFLTRKSNKELRLDILGLLPASDWPLFTPILERMTRQELLDTYRVLRTPENTKTASIDPAFKVRVIAISKKYNIFT